MMNSFIAMLCAQGIYTAACNNAIQAGMIQSGADQYINQNIKNVTTEGSKLLGKEFTTFFTVGVIGYRLNSGREVQKHFKSPISDSLILSGSKNSGRIELKWSF